MGDILDGPIGDFGELRQLFRTTDQVRGLPPGGYGGTRRHGSQYGPRIVVPRTFPSAPHAPNGHQSWPTYPVQVGSLLIVLSDAERARLDRTMPYLNMSELRQVCRRFGVPWAIYIDGPDRLRRTKDVDRKLVVLERLRRYLETGQTQKPTVYPASVAAPRPLAARPVPEDRLFQGHYDKNHAGLQDLLGRLTGGEFRNGAVARLLCRDYWERGETPTFEEFATAWFEADKRGLGVARGEHPEAAYLTDRARGTVGPDGRARRAAYAAEALGYLSRL